MMKLHFQFTVLKNTNMLIHQNFASCLNFASGIKKKKRSKERETTFFGLLAKKIIIIRLISYTWSNDPYDIKTVF